MRPPSSTLAVEVLEAAVSAEFVTAGFSQATAEAIAELSVCTICSVLSSSQVYVPQRLLNQYRDRVIYRMANGHNTAELANEHNLSERHIARIVRRARLAKGRV